MPATEFRCWQASEARKGGKKQGFKYLRDDQGDFVYQPATMKTGDVDPSTGYNQKQYDTRNMLVAMLDPSVELDPLLGMCSTGKQSGLETIWSELVET